MKGEKTNIINNLIKAISILNNTDEYLESLDDRLSKYDSMNSDFEHFIEFTHIEEVNLKKLYLQMQKLYQNRRKIKNDMTINKNYQNNIEKLKEKTNRQFLIQSLKNVDIHNENLIYTNRILTEEEINKLKIKKRKK